MVRKQDIVWGMFVKYCTIKVYSNKETLSLHIGEIKVFHLHAQEKHCHACVSGAPNFSTPFNHSATIA